MKPEEILADALRNPSKYNVKGCAVCKRPDIVVAGLFDPPASLAKRLGQPTGKKRFITYGLCGDCAKMPDVADRVEVEILKQMGVH